MVIRPTSRSNSCNYEFSLIIQKSKVIQEKAVKSFIFKKKSKIFILLGKLFIINLKNCIKLYLFTSILTNLILAKLLDLFYNLQNN